MSAICPLQKNARDQKGQTADKDAVQESGESMEPGLATQLDMCESACICIYVCVCVLLWQLSVYFASRRPQLICALQSRDRRPRRLAMFVLSMTIRA